MNPMLVTLHINGRERLGVLVKANRPGHYNVWPANETGARVPGAHALLVNIIDFEAARKFPEHASTIEGSPDTSG